MGRQYQLFGYVVSSELTIPVRSLKKTLLNPDLAVTCGKLPETKGEGKKIGLRLTQYDDAAILVIDNIAKFYIDSNQIIVESSSDIDEMTLVTFLMSAVLPLWLQLKGCFLLKGSALTFDDKQAVLLLGNSGVGKSTLLAHACQQGAKMLSDEICLLEYDIDRKRCVLKPAYPLIKLWHHACKLLSMSPKAFLKVRPDVFRYHWGAFEVYCKQILPVNHVFSYSTYNIDKPLIEEALKGINKFEQVQKHKLQLFSSQANLCRAAHQEILITLLQQTNCYPLNRIKKKTKPDDLFTAINDAIVIPSAEESACV